MQERAIDLVAKKCQRLTWRRIGLHQSLDGKAYWLLLVVCALLSIASAAHAQSTNYVYDANGRVVAVIPLNGNGTQYSYNALGSLAQVTSTPANQLAIFAFQPTHGVAGTQVTIQGQGFDSNAVNDTVTFNGALASVLSASRTQLLVDVPSGATTGPINVSTGAQAATSGSLFVVDDTGLPPTISSMSATVVSVGQTLKITGSHFDPVANSTFLLLAGRYDAQISAINDSQIQHTITINDSTGYVTVETPYGEAISANPLIIAPSGINPANITTMAFATEGNSVNLNIGDAGQVGAMLFQGNAGDWISVQLSAISTAANMVHYEVYAPGNQLVQQGTISSTSPSIHLPQLLTGGTYMAVFTPDTAGAQLAVSYEHATTLSMATPITLTTTVPGASRRVLFQASAGQSLAFQISGVSTTPSAASVNYAVYAPSGVSYMSAATASTGLINLGNLPTSGTYQVVIAPGIGIIGSMQAELVAGVSGKPGGVAESYTSNAAGQNVYLNFTANQGDNLEFTLYDLAVSGSGSNSVSANVYSESGNNIGSVICYTNNPGGSCRIQLWNLAAGAYSVVVAPSNASSTMTFNVLLEPDVIGPVLSYGSPTTVNLAEGQVKRLSFTANAGDTISLNLSGINTTAPMGQPVGISVYSPDRGVPTVTNPYTYFSNTSATMVNLPNLPATGTYIVEVWTPYCTPGTVQITLAKGTLGALSTNGLNQTYAAAQPGQDVYLSFQANQGDSLEFTLYNLAVADSGATNVQVNAYNVAGNNIGSVTCYTTNPAGSCRLQLWNLASGEYSIVVTSPNTASIISFNTLLKSDVIGPQLAYGTPTIVNLAEGEVARLTFTATAGDTISLNLAGISTTSPSGQAVGISVYSPNNGTPTTTNNYTYFYSASSTMMNLPNLPATGTYMVEVWTPYCTPGSVQITLAKGTLGTVGANGSSQNYSVAEPGQNVYLRFQANTNDNLELTLYNFAISGSTATNASVNVYDQKGNNVGSTTCYTSNPMGSCRIQVWNLAAQTYSVVVTAPSVNSMMSFNTVLERDLIGPNVNYGAATTINLSEGEVERLTFNGSTGDTVSVGLSGINTTPAGQVMGVSVYSPDRGTPTITNEYAVLTATNSNTMTITLPVTGTYMLEVWTTYFTPGTGQLVVSNSGQIIVSP